MRISKLTRRGEIVRNFLVIVVALLIAWGANGFGSLTLEGAIERAAAEYFGKPGTIVAVEEDVFGQYSSADAIVITDRGDGNLHIYAMERGWMWLYRAAYKGAYPIENDECTVLLNKWKREDGTLEYKEYHYIVNDRSVTVWIERFD